ncbi:MAG: hypothetical protein IK132_11850 [Clostridia bacterium]|nr:hypothetical protein [Clostridia bacterium]
MRNEKTSSSGRVLVIFLLLCNLAMIVWIVVSWRQANKPQSTVEYYSSLGYDVSSLTGESGGTSSDSESSPGNGSSAGSSIGSSDGSQTIGNADSWIFDDEPASDNTQTSQMGEQASVSYSTTDRPEETDFDGWKSHGGAVPSGASVLKDFGAVAGSWKGFIQYDMAEELVNFTITPAQSGAELKVDWYLIHYFGDGSWMNEEDMEDLSYTGSWSDGILTASGAISITIRSFYEIGGQQFAVGEMTLADGSSAVVGMVRP